MGFPLSVEGEVLIAGRPEQEGRRETAFDKQRLDVLRDAVRFVLLHVEKRQVHEPDSHEARRHER